MKDTEIIIEIAKLDGFKFYVKNSLGADIYHNKDGRICGIGTFNTFDTPFPNYLTSRDAIVPVIEKLDNKTWDLFESELWKLCKIECLANKQRFLNDIRRKALLGTPRQLCIALLKATGKWKD